MNTSLAIPQVLHAFNIYDKGNVARGISRDVGLPNFEAMTETVSGPGIAGEIEAPILGFFNSMELELPWAVIYGDFYKTLEFQKNAELMLRGSVQVENRSNGALEETACRLVFRGKTKKVELGNATQGGKNENKTTYEITYLKLEEAGETKVELDKENFVFNVNGTDLLAEVRKNI